MLKNELSCVALTTEKNNNMMSMQEKKSSGLLLNALTKAVIGSVIVLSFQQTVHAGLFGWNKKEQPVISTEDIDALEYLLEATDMKAVENDPKAIRQYGDLWIRIQRQMTLNTNSDSYRVNSQIAWFSKHQDYLNRLSNRASRYLYHTVTEAERRGLPVELALLPIIESSYDPASTSSAAAAGLWQFIPSTGKIYSLEQNGYYDGRRDVVESTRAAYDFLSDLYQKFGSWELALAAYNAGPARVQQAINKNASKGLGTDYWSLSLPKETMNYVPRFMAVASVVKSPANYGVNLPQIANRAHFRTVTLPGPIDLQQLSDLTNVDLTELFQLNPAFKLGKTSPFGPHRILLPQTVPLAVDRQVAKMPTLTLDSYNINGLPQPILASSNISKTTLPVISSPTALTSTPSKPEFYKNQESYYSPIFNDSTGLNAIGSVTNTSSVNQTTVKSTVHNTIQPVTATVQNTTTIPKKELPKDSQSLADLASRSVKAQVPEYMQQVPEMSSTNQPSLTEGLTALKTGVIPPVVQQPTTTTTYLPPVQQPTTIKTPTVYVPPVDTPPIKVPDQVHVQPNLPQETVVIPVTTVPTVIKQNPTVSIPQVTTTQITPSVPTVSTAVTQETIPPTTAYTRANSTPSPSIIQDMETDVFGRTPLKSQPLPSQTVAIQPTVNEAVVKPLFEQKEIPVVEDIKPVKTTVSNTSESPVSSKRPDSYEVEAGDTLIEIADKFNLYVKDLALYNDIEVTSNVQTGQRLYLSEATAKKAGKMQPKSTVSYKRPTKVEVTKSDTLSSIASDYDLTLTQLAMFNDVDTDYKVRLGQMIQIPTEAEVKQLVIKPVDKKSTEKRPTKVKVVKGDTLTSIAQKYDLSLAGISAFNEVPTDFKVKLGDEVLIPTASEAKKALAKVSQEKAKQEKVKQEKAKKESEKPTYYTLKSGDNLSKIASKYGMSLSELAKANGIPTNASLRVGDQVIIPKN